MRRPFRLVVVACLLATRLDAQANDPSKVTIERIFTTRDFAAAGFGPTAWTPDGNGYTTVEPSAGGAGSDLVRYDAASGARTVVVPASRLVPAGASTPLAIDGYDWSPDARGLLIFTNSARVWRDNTRGDYWVLNLTTGALKQLGKGAPASTLMFAKWSPKGDRVAYVRQNNVYVEDVTDGLLTRLTQDGGRTIINGTTDWVYEEELNLRDAFRWSPDGTRIAYWQLDAGGVRDFLMINSTDSLYSFTIPVQYPKAGTTNSSARVGVVSANGGATTWFNVPGDPRNNYIARMEWAPDAGSVVIQHLNRKQNTLTLFSGDPRTGAVRPIHVEQDSAWVDAVDDFRWLDRGGAYTWVSEADGWRHLFVRPRASGQAKLVTRGDYDVGNVVQIDVAGGWVYFIASPTTGIQRYLYRAKLDGSQPAVRLTPTDAPGTHRYDVSPNGKFAIHVASSFGAPPQIDLVALPDHRRLRALADNAALRSTVQALARGKQEFVRVPIGDGVELDAYLMYPPDFDASRKYPVIFHVYGEPASQTVTDSWGGRNYLWHVMLTQQGYIVASVDNRGTPSLRGRAWRKSIYGKVGLLNSADQAAAAKEMLRTRPFLDPSRVGVWGWSGGGSMTLNLLFRSPELYKVGMSIAPVSDERNYDTIYQERYMGLPGENSEGYRLGSPITFADKLEGKLLLVHGTGDDNVHYQNAEQLVNKLVAANRPFTMMSYPNRSHGIFEGTNTSRHLFELLTRYLRENLPAGASAIQ
ncbi:MAG: S9 family peptidase [Cytophagaceae bacterium]|nr:S9 family peptidase [Gemmatimonadaceae bacterium]